jgi:hypothetical protein
MKTLFALPVAFAATLGMSSGAMSQGAGAFSYQKQWWPDAVTTTDGVSLGSGEAYRYAGPSGPDLWNDPRAWWPDYDQGSVAAPYTAQPGYSYGSR